MKPCPLARLDRDLAAARVESTLHVPSVTYLLQIVVLSLCLVISESTLEAGPKEWTVDRSDDFAREDLCRWNPSPLPVPPRVVLVTTAQTHFAGVACRRLTFRNDYSG